jgi:hypothetical protein
MVKIRGSCVQKLGQQINPIFMPFMSFMVKAFLKS